MSRLTGLSLMHFGAAVALVCVLCGCEWTDTIAEPPAVPILQTQPGHQTVVEGDTATFTVVASGSGVLSYQWKRDGVDIPGATEATYTMPAVAVADSGAQFTCVVSNAGGSVESTAATLIVVQLPAGPEITVQPQDQLVVEGQPATFTVQATGSGALAYQWHRNGTAIPGATTQTYAIPATVHSDDGSKFSCVVADDQGSTETRAATLTVQSTTVWFVDCDVSSSGDGRSWASAFKTIWEAIGPSGAASAGEEVWVAEGSYTKNSGRPAVLEMQPDVWAFGGFNGIEASRNERDWQANVTTLDGENSGRVVEGADDARLDGFVITRGTGSSGGGMYNYMCSPTVANCLFTGNHATNRGGAVYSQRVCSPTFTNCVFHSNSCDTDGGAMYNMTSPTTITSCTFTANTASSGGAIYVYESYTPPLNCVFNANSAKSGGAIRVANTNITCRNCTFYRNTASNSEGGGALGSYDEYVTFRNCILRGNTSGSPGYDVVGMYSTIRFYNCSVEPRVPGAPSKTGSGNVKLDPRFVDPDGPDDVPGSLDDDLRLCGYSPCIDAGDGDEAPETDSVGRPRHDDAGVPDTGIGTPSYADIGAHEFQSHSLVILAHPQDLTVTIEQTATFSMTASGPDTYQWRRNGADIPGATAATYETPATVLADHGAVFCCVVTSGGQHFMTDAATLTLEWVWHVDPDVAASGDGSTWALAFKTIQEAVGPSGVARQGDEVWVAEGTYTNNGGGTATVLEMRSGVAIYGGFKGIESDLSQRDWVTNVTILDGEDTAYHVVEGANDATLDGFTITRGNGTQGGGMYNYEVSPTVANCTFTGNSAGSGGAVLSRNGSLPTFRNCAFVGNSAGTDGGAMHNWFWSSPRVVDCVFRDNLAGGDGGAVSNNWESSPVVTDCVFTGNTAQVSGGAVHNANDSSPVLASCLFVDNYAIDGGVIYVGFAGCRPRLANCVLAWNRATRGGAVYNYGDGTVRLTNCTLAGNHAEDYGGGLCNTGVGTDFCTSLLVNCIVWGNTADVQGSEIWTDSVNICLAGYCDIGQYADFTGQGGNINADPRFVDPDGPDGIPGNEDDDFHLQPGSPCIDSGDPATTLAEDIEGNPRPAGSGYDMGAYEYVQ